jgi:3-isopropylmalate dehydrogenase
MPRRGVAGRHTLHACRGADAVLLGAVGGPKWSDPNAPVRPEQGPAGDSQALGLYANLRPVQYRILPHSTRAPIKAESAAGRGHDRGPRADRRHLLRRKRSRTADHATDLCSYSVARSNASCVAPSGWPGRRGYLVTSVDKANVLETSRLWREVTTASAREEFPDVRSNTNWSIPWPCT